MSYTLGTVTVTNTDDNSSEDIAAEFITDVSPEVYYEYDLTNSILIVTRIESEGPLSTKILDLTAGTQVDGNDTYDASESIGPSTTSYVVNPTVGTVGVKIVNTSTSATLSDKTYPVVNFDLLFGSITLYYDRVNLILGVLAEDGT